MKKFKLALLTLAALLTFTRTANAITTTVCPGVGCIDINTAGQGSIGIQFTGTWSGTITFRGSLGNTPASTFTDLLVMPVGSTTPVTTTTGNGVWTTPIAGVNQVRVVFTAWVSGTANVVFRTTTSAKNLITTPGGAAGFVNQAANTVFSGPATGADAAPTFRLLVAADLGTTLSPVFGATVSGTRFRAGPGTALLPAYSFTADTSTGFWNSASVIYVALGGQTQFNFTTTSVALKGSSAYSWSSNLPDAQVSDTFLRRAGAGMVSAGTSGSIGSVLKVDALPTVASGFGATTPTIIAGSTPFAGAVDVGTGLIATSGVVNFNGTAFPVAPFCTCQDSDSITAGVCKAKATTTQLTITTTVAATASDDIQWLCVGSR